MIANRLIEDFFLHNFLLKYDHFHKFLRSKLISSKNKINDNYFEKIRLYNKLK